MLAPYLISQLFSLAVLWLSRARPGTARVLLGLLFVGASGFNLVLALHDPQLYVRGFGPLALGSYRTFIEGSFAAAPLRFLIPIAAGQLACGALLLADGVLARIGAFGAMVFLLAISGLGLGAAFPASYLLAAAAFLVALSTPATRPHAPHGLWGRWVLANGFGELLGLGLVAAGAVALRSWAPAPAAAIAVVLGALEGAILGALQWRAMHPWAEELDAARWIRATVFGALCAWALGMIPSLLLPAESAGGGGPPWALTQLFAVLLGAAGGLVLALFQGRAFGPRRRRWWIANALAWAVGMPLLFAVVDLAAALRGASAVAVIAYGLFAVGAAVGAIHGVALPAALGIPARAPFPLQPRHAV